MAFAPLFSTQPIALTTSEGSTADFIVAASGDPAIGYRWYKDGTIIAGAAGATSDYLIASLATTDVGSYLCQASNSEGVSNSAAVDLRVLFAPRLYIQPTNHTTNEGTSASLVVGWIANPAATIRWYKDGITTDGTAIFYHVAATATTDIGWYTARVSNGRGVTNSAGATIDVLYGPRIYTQPIALTTIEGTSGGIVITVSAKPAPSILWYKGGVAVVGATSVDFFRAALVTSEGGSYVARSSNSQGVTNSVAAVVNIQCSPKFATQPVSRSLGQGASVSFSVLAIANPATIGYRWYKDGTIIAGAAGATSEYFIASVAESDQATYTCLVSNSLGGRLSAGAVLSIGSLADVDNLPEPAHNFIPDLEGPNRRPGSISVPIAGSAVLLKALERIADGSRVALYIQRKSRVRTAPPQIMDLVLMPYSLWTELSLGTTATYEIIRYKTSYLLQAESGGRLNTIVTRKPLGWTVLFLMSRLNDVTPEGVIIRKDMYDVL